jgi:hypothetical protein
VRHVWFVCGVKEVKEWKGWKRKKDGSVRADGYGSFPSTL